MPDIPPLVGHFKGEAGDWDSKMAMVSATAGEAASVIDILQEAYDGARDAALEDAEANHMLRDATVESATATELLGHLLDVARDHALENAASNAWLARSLKEVRDVQLEEAVATRASTTSRTTNTAANVAATGAGFPLIGVLVGIGVAAGVALAPVAALTVGFLGAVTALGLFMAGAGAFGIVAILVANATGQVNRQIAQLQHVAQGAANTLGKELAPMARQFLGLLTQLVPIAVQAVQPMIHAFQLITPALLPLLKVLSVDLLQAIGQVGLAFAVFASDVVSRQGSFESLFSLLTSQGVQAVVGLLDNLLRLSDWFFRELPALGGPTGGFFSLLGSLVQGAASIIARFAEWVGANWPTISGFFVESAQEIAAGFQWVSPAIGAALVVLRAMGPVVQFIKDHAEELKPILYAIGGLAAVMAASFLLTAGSVLLVVGALVGLFLIGDKVVNWLKVEVPAGIRAAGAGLSALGGFVRGALDGIGSAIGGFFSGLGSGVRAGIAAVGAFFQELGTRVHGTIVLAWDGIVGIFRAGVAVVTGVVSAFVRGVVGFFGWLYNHNYYFQAVVDFVRTQFVRARNEAVAIWGAITSFLASTWATISGDVRAAWSAITGWLSAQWATISGIASAAWAAVAGFIGARTNDARNVITSVWSAVTGWLGGIWNQIASVAGAMWGVVSSVIGGKVHEAWNTITGVFGGLGGWFADRSRDAWNWGYNLIQSIGKGIGAAAGAIAQAVRAIGGVIADWLGFHSPTRLGPGAEADMWAPNFIRMYAGGLRAGAGSVRAAASDLAAATRPLAGRTGVPVVASAGADRLSTGSWPGATLSMRDTNELLEGIRDLLASIDDSLQARPGFSARAYGRS